MYHHVRGIASLCTIRVRSKGEMYVVLKMEAMLWIRSPQQSRAVTT